MNGSSVRLPRGLSNVPRGKKRFFFYFFALVGFLARFLVAHDQAVRSVKGLLAVLSAVAVLLWAITATPVSKNDEGLAQRKETLNHGGAMAAGVSEEIPYDPEIHPLYCKDEEWMLYKGTYFLQRNRALSRDVLLLPSRRYHGLLLVISGGPRGPSGVILPAPPQTGLIVVGKLYCLDTGVQDGTVRVSMPVNHIVIKTNFTGDGSFDLDFTTPGNIDTEEQFLKNPAVVTP